MALMSASYAYAFSLICFLHHLITLFNKRFFKYFKYKKNISKAPEHTLNADFSRIIRGKGICRN